METSLAERVSDARQRLYGVGTEPDVASEQLVARAALGILVQLEDINAALARVYTALEELPIGSVGDNTVQGLADSVGSIVDILDRNTPN